MAQQPVGSSRRPPVADPPVAGPQVAAPGPRRVVALGRAAGLSGRNARPVRRQSMAAGPLPFMEGEGPRRCAAGGLPPALPSPPICRTCQHVQSAKPLTPDREPAMPHQPTETARTTARILMEIGAVLFRPEDPFTFTSGRKSPVYVDCRKIISYPRARAKLMDLAVQQVSARPPGTRPSTPSPAARPRASRSPPGWPTGSACRCLRSQEAQGLRPQRPDRGRPAEGRACCWSRTWRPTAAPS